MLFSPTKRQRQRLLGALASENDCLQENEEAGSIDSHDGTLQVDDADVFFQDGTPIETLLGMAFCLSPFVFLFRKKGIQALYHSLTLRKIVGDDRLSKIYRLGKSGASHVLSDYLALLNGDGNNIESFRELELLVRHGFLLPHYIDPLLSLRRKQKESRFHSPMVRTLYLHLSNDCNLRCRYCSIESLERKPPSFRYTHMSPRTARAGIDLFLRTLNRDVMDPRIIYYGGEPLLNPEALIDSISYIREKQSQGQFNGGTVDAFVVCNGTLVTEEIAAEMKRLSVGAAVSLDGERRHHDRLRRYKDGRGSWDDALRGYEILKRHLGECSILCTLGPHNYQDTEEITEFFASRLECRGMGFNILRGLPPGNGLEIPSALITREMIKAYRILRALGIHEDRIMRKISSFVNEEPRYYDCGCCGGQIALCADGFVGPCHNAADAHRFCWGTIDDPFIDETILQGELMRDWCRRAPLAMGQCIDCVGLGICGGGCADEAYMKSGDIFALDEGFCTHTRELIDWMFEDLAVHLLE
jgi:uncharacterized protein